MLNFSFLVHNEGRARGVAGFLVINSVIFDRFSFPIAQEREFHADVLGKTLVGGETVHADAENLRVGGVEFGDIRLIRLQLLRSAAGESKNVKSQHDGFFALKIA